MKEKKSKGKKIKVFQKRKPDIDAVIDKLKSAYIGFDPKNVNRFSDLPLSPNTQKGLRESEYTTPTEIQKESIGSALQGNDILGAAKTGSGKTLAFLIPVLETLFCKKWTRLDGVGALIITPTRELAYQIFETLRKVGHYHDFSAGLIIGGKDLHFEKKRMDQCNIVICTPGRLLHHMDENPLFDCVNLQILVLDEADRCLDMGFEETMNSIIANLPPQRQTLLFSATQTKSIRDLARLSLTMPKYISVHEHAEHSTPEGLKQNYIVCELEDKLANLWSFIRTHVKHKILVFFATCKQVKFTFEVCCQLRPGIALLALHGGMHQEKRMKTYRSFCNKEHAILFATDVAARGLDFPAVNWVLQMDCPEDATTYIHRVGRTARYHKGGEAVLFLLPSEKDAMLVNLSEKKIPLEEIKINPLKIHNPKSKIEAILAKRPNIKAMAQRAFVTYLKSVFVMKDKNVFNIHRIQTDPFARSLGLVVSPRIRFLQKLKKEQKSEPNESAGVEEEKDDEEEEEEKLNADEDRVTLLDALYSDGDDEDDDDILRIKRKDHTLEGVEEEEEPLEMEPGRRKKKHITKAALAKKALRRNIVPNRKTVFTEDGEAVENKFKRRVTELGKKYEDEDGEGGISIEEARRVLKEEDKIDRQIFRDRIKMKHKEERLKLKNAKKKEDEEEDGDDLGEEEEGASEREWSEGDDSDGGGFSRADDDADDSEQVSGSENEASYRSSSRKLVAQGRKRKKYESDEENVYGYPGSSLTMDEELALQLLKKKR